MRNFVITIARQYGSGGREIGQLVSEKLGYEFYDKNLITMAAQKSGLSSEQLSHVDETASNSLLYTLALGSSIYNRGYDSINLPINDRLFVLQSGIIKEVAESGKGAVIVGRCADSVLEGFPNVVRVFISGGFSKRVETIMSRHGLTEQEAKDITIKTDRRRSNYYSYYTGEKWGKVDRYDLIVNTDKTGVSGSADIICEYLKHII